MNLLHEKAYLFWLITLVIAIIVPIFIWTKTKQASKEKVNFIFLIQFTFVMFIGLITVLIISEAFIFSIIPFIFLIIGIIMIFIAEIRCNNFNNTSFISINL